MLGAKLFIVAAIIGSSVARPETYKEKEDFQYSRSSSDDGTKSGFYAAQRGNVAGNYEKAHNMDNLANTQLDTVRYGVDGSLAKYTGQAAGGSSFGVADATGHQSSLGVHNQYRQGQQGAGYNQNYNQGYSNSGGRYSSDYTKTENRKENYEQYGSSNNANARYHYVPAYQPAYSHTSGNYINSEYQNTNVLGVEAVTVPSVVEKKSESEYKYEKEWQRTHGGSVNPAAVIPLSRQFNDNWQQNQYGGYGSAYTHQNQQFGSQSSFEKGKEDHSHYDSAYVQPYVNPLPLYTQNVEAESIGNSGYNKEYERVAESKYNKEWERLYGSHGASNQFNGAYVDSQHAVGQAGKPKQFESSYSYHKSWEKHGDPYVIQGAPEKIVDC